MSVNNNNIPTLFPYKTDFISFKFEILILILLIRFYHIYEKINLYSIYNFY